MLGTTSGNNFLYGHTEWIKTRRQFFIHTFIKIQPPRVSPMCLYRKAMATATRFTQNCTMGAWLPACIVLSYYACSYIVA